MSELVEKLGYAYGRVRAFLGIDQLAFRRNRSLNSVLHGQFAKAFPKSTLTSIWSGVQHLLEQKL